MRKFFSKRLAALMMAAGLVLGAPAGTGEIFGYSYSGTVYAADTDTEETEAPPVEDTSYYDDQLAKNRGGASDLPPGEEDMATIVYSRSGDKSIAKPTQSQILAKFNTAASVNVTRTFVTNPSVIKPYSIGKLDTTFVNSAYTFLNFYRYCI